MKLLQKEMRGYDSILFDLSTQARSNRKMIGTEFFLDFQDLCQNNVTDFQVVKGMVVVFRNKIA